MKFTFPIVSALSVTILSGLSAFAELNKETYKIDSSKNGQAFAIPHCGKSATAMPKSYEDGSVKLSVKNIESCSMYWIPGTEGGKLDGGLDHPNKFYGEFKLPAAKSTATTTSIYLESQKAFKSKGTDATVAKLEILIPARKAEQNSLRDIYLGSNPTKLPNCGGSIQLKSSKNNGDTQFNVLIKENQKCESLQILTDDMRKEIKSYKLNKGSTSSFTIPEKTIVEGLDLGIIALGVQNTVVFKVTDAKGADDVVRVHFVDYGNLSAPSVSKNAEFVPDITALDESAQY